MKTQPMTVKRFMEKWYRGWWRKETQANQTWEMRADLLVLLREARRQEREIGERRNRELEEDIEHLIRVSRKYKAKLERQARRGKR